MSNENNGRIFVVDFETWGLHYLDDPILEVGVAVCNLKLERISTFHALVWDDEQYQMLQEEHAKNNTFVHRMHTESGLFADAYANGETSEDVSVDWMLWLDQQNVDPKKDYLAGSSTHFDSTMMFFNFPEVRGRFHHRVIDVSSVKVMTELWYPKTVAQLKEEVKPAKKHRVLPDIEDTLDELRWYLENVFPEGDNPND